MSRLVDRGAIFAGWVGLGMSVVAGISLALVIAVQSLVFIYAPVGGLLIGYYANARSERRAPWRRVLANALYAGVVTAIALALLYAALRLLFVYADNGYPGFNGPGQESCVLGPDCTYQRYVEAGRGQELGRLGVGDAASFERYAVREQLNGSLTLLVLTLAGSLVGGAFVAVAPGSSRRTVTTTPG